MNEDTSIHFTQSVLREVIAEHLLIGGLLQRLWQRNITDAEVLRSEFDAGGYDLVLSRAEIVRHIQLKTISHNARTPSFSASLKLALRPSGCVVVLVLNEMLGTDHYLWFGGRPGEPLPNVDGYQVTRHPKRNAQGLRTERPGHRVVPKSQFQRLATLDDLIYHLLGPDLTPACKS